MNDTRSAGPGVSDVDRRNSAGPHSAADPLTAAATLQRSLAQTEISWRRVADAAHDNDPRSFDQGMLALHDAHATVAVDLEHTRKRRERADAHACSILDLLIGRAETALRTPVPARPTGIHRLAEVMEVLPPDSPLPHAEQAGYQARVSAVFADLPRSDSQHLATLLQQADAAAFGYGWHHTLVDPLQRRWLRLGERRRECLLEILTDRQRLRRRDQASGRAADRHPPHGPASESVADTTAAQPSGFARE